MKEVPLYKLKEGEQGVVVSVGTGETDSAEKQELQTESREKAGRILLSMLERKKETGCYQVFQRGRKQYFLPAFLRGSTGIAWVMLRYAENVLDEVTNPGA